MANSIDETCEKFVIQILGLKVVNKVIMWKMLFDDGSVQLYPEHELWEDDAFRPLVRTGSSLPFEEDSEELQIIVKIIVNEKNPVNTTVKLRRHEIGTTTEDSRKRTCENDLELSGTYPTKRQMLDSVNHCVQNGKPLADEEENLQAISTLSQNVARQLPSTPPSLPNDPIGLSKLVHLGPKKCKVLTGKTAKLD